MLEPELDANRKTVQSSTASFCCLLCTEAHRLKGYPLTALYNYIINHICWYISLTPWIPPRLKTCEWCLCTEVLNMLNFFVKTCLQQKRDLALGQLSFCWAGRSKFLFLTHCETHSCWEQHSSSSAAALGELFSLSCPSSAKEGGLTPPARWPSPGGEGADSWAGLDIAGVFLGMWWGISSWHCRWPEEKKITIFSQGSWP